MTVKYATIEAVNLWTCNAKNGLMSQFAGNRICHGLITGDHLLSETLTLYIILLVLSSYFLLLQRSKWLLLELFEWDLSHFVDVSRKRIIDLAA